MGQEDGQIELFVSGGNPGYNYVWSNGQNTSITDFIDNIDKLDAYYKYVFIAPQIENNLSITNINIVNENKVDSLAIKKDKKPRKTAKQKVVMPKVKLSINTIPEKVEVSLDGNILGETPIIGKKISPGEHTFQIQKDGYAPISYGLNVNPSKSVSLDFFMNPVYDIKFKTEEVGLIFELNDTHRWTDNTIGMQIEAGNHHLRVYKLGEIIDEQVIIADQPLTFQYYLKRGTVSQPAK